MKRQIGITLALSICVFLYCCTLEKSQEKQVIAKINDYELTFREFEEQLITELEMNPDYKLTQSAKIEFLEQLIRKELLIQEAKKLKLDRKNQFIKTIERYWESTLIRDLMELKGKSLSQRTYITKEEIEARYQLLKTENSRLPPRNELWERIKNSLKEEKKQIKLKEWIINLRENAQVETDLDLLQSMK